MRIHLILALLLLAGCSTTTATLPNGTEVSAEEAADHEKCVSQYGFQFSTPGYAQCRMQLADLHQGEQQERKERSARLFDYGQRLLNPPRPKTTHCTTFGAMTDCTTQ